MSDSEDQNLGDKRVNEPGQLGDCPCCGTQIAEARTHVESVNIDGQSMPRGVELTLSPCRCRFFGGQAAEIGGQLYRRQRGGSGV